MNPGERYDEIYILVSMAYQVTGDFLPRGKYADWWLGGDGEIDDADALHRGFDDRTSDDADEDKQEESKKNPR